MITFAADAGGKAVFLPDRRSILFGDWLAGKLENPIGQGRYVVV